MEPIGLLGGSFDPIHVGHLQLARDALANLPIAAVHFLPAAQPWQKETVTPADHRAQMIRLGVDPDEAMTRTANLSDQEIRRIADLGLPPGRQSWGLRLRFHWHP